MAATADQYKTKLRQLPVLQSILTEIPIGELPATPQEAFKQWLDEAISVGVREAHAMVVSTVDADGCPDARVLILKNVDARGWHFAIKADSPKGRQLMQNGQAALTWYWPDMARQVRLRGAANALPEDECLADFKDRPIKAQAGAIASKQSEVLTDREDLRNRVVEVEIAMSKGESEDVPKWVVFAVAPKTVEFWQGAKDRLHQRVRYTAQAGETGWSQDLIYP